MSITEPTLTTFAIDVNDRPDNLTIIPAESAEDAATKYIEEYRPEPEDVITVWGTEPGYLYMSARSVLENCDDPCEDYIDGISDEKEQELQSLLDMWTKSLKPYYEATEELFRTTVPTEDGQPEEP
jgi:hypothetical protein